MSNNVNTISYMFYYAGENEKDSVVVGIMEKSKSL